ncbi:alpha/beta hydrolase [Streptomyces sp. NPDC051546]|uniref:alpha/beta hydrolase n=1 Tax=Streptomyces sp. NPDC051546 TaxID=3365655 RepID=UPI0037A9E890
MPSPITIIQCHLDQGNRSSRAGTRVVTVSVFESAFSSMPGRLPGHPAAKRRGSPGSGVSTSGSAAMPGPAPGAPVPPIRPPTDGFLFLDRDRFADSFAADVPAATAAFMADSQVPWGVDALDGAVCEPAWQTRPSWYLVATDDRMIPPAAQRAMSERAGATVTETPGSHAVYVSRPAVVAAVIAQAARAAGWPLPRPPRLAP